MACSTGACPISSGVPSFAGRYGYPSTFEAVEAAKMAAINRDAAWVNAASMGTNSTFGATGIPSVYNRFGGVSPISNIFGGVPVNNWTAGYPTVYDRFGGFNSYNPWTAGYNTFGGINAFNASAPYNTWAANMTFGGMPSTLERFGGYPWGSEFSGRNFENNNNNLYTIGFRPSSSIECYTLTNPIRVLDREGNRMVWLCFDLKGYKPEEITVTLNKAERAVVVEAAHEAKDGKEHHVIRKFNRKFVLPESLSKVDLTKVELKSCLNVEGLLSVEIALPKMTVEEINKCPTTSRLINELSYGPSGSFSSGYGYPSTFGGLTYGSRPHFHAINNACGACFDNVKPVTVKTA